ncbi:MAG: chorismate mutase [Chloroflexi bacterium]|nr:chorismate mutase [Chloroflexota bacterium]
MPMMCRGLRGAITAEGNTKEAIVAATTELLRALVEANQLEPEMIAAAFFTTTADLNAEFPAVAARKLGWNQVALMCGHEMQVPDAVSKVIRVLVLVNTEKRPEELKHCYLRGAANLRSRGMS